MGVRYYNYGNKDRGAALMSSGIYSQGSEYRERKRRRSGRGFPASFCWCATEYAAHCHVKWRAIKLYITPLYFYFMYILALHSMQRFFC